MCCELMAAEEVQENWDSDDERVIRGKGFKGWRHQVSGVFSSKFRSIFATASCNPTRKLRLFPEPAGEKSLGFFATRVNPYFMAAAIRRWRQLSANPSHFQAVRKLAQNCL